MLFLSFHVRVLLNREAISKQLHPSPLSSFQPPSSSFSLHPAFCNTLNVFRTKTLHVGRKTQICSILTEVSHTWYLGDADYKSGLRLLKLGLQNPFFSKFGPKSQSYLLCLKIGTHVSRILILIPALVFWISNRKSIEQIWTKKSKLPILHENWHAWCIEDADSYFDISFCKFQNLNPFLGRVRPRMWSYPFDMVTHVISRVLICLILNL